MVEGCSYGHVTRTLVEGLKENMSNEFVKLDSRLTDLFNHQSTHIPQETVTDIKLQWKLISVLSSILTTIIGSIVTYFIMNT